MHVMGQSGEWDRGLAVGLGRPLGEVARRKAATCISKVGRSRLEQELGSEKEGLGGRRGGELGGGIAGGGHYPKHLTPQDWN